MHRRQLISAAASALTLGIVPRASGQQATPEATPIATPQHFGRPRPIVLGDGIELLDYRIYPSEGTRSIIGEIVSTRDDMVDAPVVSLTFPGQEKGDVAWAVPVLPVMEPGGSNMFFGALPEGVETLADLEGVSFGLCGPIQAGDLTVRHLAFQYTLTKVQSLVGDRWHWIRGTIRSDGPEIVQWPLIRGLVRDVFGRYAGCTPARDLHELQPGVGVDFTIMYDENTPFLANPFALLDGSTDYTVELYPGVVGEILAPTCRAAFPWNEQN